MMSCLCAHAIQVHVGGAFYGLFVCMTVASYSIDPPGPAINGAQENGEARLIRRIRSSCEFHTQGGVMTTRLSPFRYVH